MQLLAPARGGGGGGYSTNAWVGRCGRAVYTLTLFKTQTNLCFSCTLFKTELHQQKRQKCALWLGFKTKSDKIDTPLKTKKTLKTIPYQLAHPPPGLWHGKDIGQYFPPQTPLPHPPPPIPHKSLINCS